MALTTFVQKLVADIRNDRKAAKRTAQGRYVDLHRRLATGEEIDSSEVMGALAATGTSEAAFEADAATMAERVEKHATMMMNRQSALDQQQASLELQRAQEAMAAAIRKLQPAIDEAQRKLNLAIHQQMVTTGCEEWLANPANILDKELLQRESEVAEALRTVSAELQPLEADRDHKRQSLANAEHQLERIQGRGPGNTWSGFGSWVWQVLPDEKPVKERIENLKSQLRQLQQHIEPRQAERERLQRALAEIHRQKLLP